MDTFRKVASGQWQVACQSSKAIVATCNLQPATLHVFLFFLLMGLLTACGGDEATVTPPIAATDTAVSVPEEVEEVEPTAEPVATTAVAEPTEAPAVEEPATPTPVPVEEPTEAPVEPTATEESVSETAPVDTLNLEFITNEFWSPVHLTHAFDDRLFVVEQYGAIRIIDDGVVLETPFLNIDDRVSDNENEQGLLSVAFHPDYQENGRFFVNYTNNNGDTVVSRFVVTADPNSADPASEVILLTIEQPYGNHNGGQIAFGPDGYLYIGMGDGGSQEDPQNHGQNANTLLGALLRIDVDVADDANPAYAIPADNPFVNDENGRNEIWATGLRNPWRFSFDRLTGDLFMADVGQDNLEELNFQPANSAGGENYGWNVLEGSSCLFGSGCDSTGMVLPIFEYDRSGGCSVTGGHIYRGSAYPELTGNYFLADFCTGYLWRVFAEEDGSWTSDLIAETGLNPSSFGEDVNGELYIVSRTGDIYKITP